MRKLDVGAKPKGKCALKSTVVNFFLFLSCKRTYALLAFKFIFFSLLKTMRVLYGRMKKNIPII